MRKASVVDNYSQIKVALFALYGVFQVFPLIVRPQAAKTISKILDVNQE
nr:MAG TPA: hypothetical protein [Caudoviricetes sp.]